MTNNILTDLISFALQETIKFDKAIIALPNREVIEGKVDSWGDYDGEQLQIKIDGVIYLTHSKNVALIAK